MNNTIRLRKFEYSIRNMKRNPAYLLSLLPGCLVIAGNLSGGWWVVSNFIFSLGLLAFLELFIRENKSNATDPDGWLPDALLFFHVLMQVCCLTSMFYGIEVNELSIGQKLMMAVSTGVNSGAAGIVIAHEMVHRKNRLYRALGQLLLWSAGNIYFYIDHLKVHHKWVGTTKDPATSRSGESLYYFFIRSVIQQIMSSFRVEKQRLKQEGGLWWSPANYVVGSALLLAAFTFIIYIVAGEWGVILFWVQSFMANFLLEYTNYIEHYGLSRSEKERVTELHSWQTDKLISRFFLIDLSRHADHHYYASRPYQQLRSYEKSPVLPGGYVSMIYYALIPPLFFKKMDPLVNKYTSKES